MLTWFYAGGKNQWDLQYGYANMIAINARDEVYGIDDYGKLVEIKRT